MLKRIYIKNNATVKELEIFPGDGLNIITGETGAGKSVILNALSLILGSRTDVKIIRYNADKLIVEAEFDLKKLTLVKNFLNKYQFTDDSDENTLLIRRIITSKGRSRAFINDNPVKLENLKELGSLLIDLHGQHEHQSLLKKDVHQDLVDRFAKNIELLRSYQESYQEWKEANKILSELEENKNKIQEKLALYEYHLQEISSVNPIKDEDSQIDSELKILEKAEDIRRYSEKADSLLHDSVFLDTFSVFSKICQDLEENDPNFKTYQEDLESARVIVEDFVSHLSSFSAKIDFDEERFKFLNQRYSDLKSLMKKFGPEIDDVLKYQNKLLEELKQGSSSSELLDKYKKKKENLENQIIKKGNELANNREEQGKIFVDMVNNEFDFLGLKGAKIKLLQERVLPNLKGSDKIEFVIKTNSGSPFESLSKIASGGEISRIMLSIKKVLSNTDDIAVLVFDEIDTGISGETAKRVSLRIADLAKSRQIFSITHLPLIAVQGETHFKVEKIDDGIETETTIKKISFEDREKEIARMLSGSENNQAALNNAKALLKSSI